MVKTVTKTSGMRPVNATIRTKSLVAEIVGPAGAGKTTLIRAFRQREQEVGAGIRLRRPRYMPLFASDTLALLPTLLRMTQVRQTPSYKELVRMVYLTVSRRVIQQQATSSPKAIILDQGPVFQLAWLQSFGPGSRQSPDFEEWWNSTLRQWTSVLDLVIQLDAPNADLLKRIRARNSWHKIQEQPEQRAYLFIEQYRACYGRIISEMMAHGQLKVLCFDTTEATANQIVDEVLTAVQTVRQES
jgi:deoxyadenosine/deoxycytidine kinase